VSVCRFGSLLYLFPNRVGCLLLFSVVFFLLVGVYMVARVNSLSGNFVGFILLKVARVNL
jgi:hypothetical protein